MSTIGYFRLITLEHMLNMDRNAFTGCCGHFGIQIEMGILHRLIVPTAAAFAHTLAFPTTLAATMSTATSW